MMTELELVENLTHIVVNMSNDEADMELVHRATDEVMLQYIRANAPDAAVLVDRIKREARWWAFA